VLLGALPHDWELALKRGGGFWRQVNFHQPRKLPPQGVSLLIVFAVFLCTVALRHGGALQFLEFQAYDYFLQHQKPAASSDPIVLVEITEADIHNGELDYPIYDNKLAELLRTLEAHQPAVIGLDIWRDMAVPRSGIYLEELNKALTSYSNIVAIFTLGGIEPPAVLKPHPERLALNDNFPPDVEVDRTVPKVRRCLLFAEAPSGESFYSFPFSLAAQYLERRGIEAELDPHDPKVLQLGRARLRKFRANDGAYVGADARGWQMLLDFKCPDAFARYSVTEALSGRIPSGALRDKIVILGMNTASVFDERVTPMRRNHRGPELQAQAVHQLLRGALDGESCLRFWNDWLEDAWLLVWCLAGGAVGYYLRAPWQFVGLSCLCLAALGVSAWGAFLAGWWIPIVSPGVAYVPAAALVTSYISHHEKKQRGQLMQLFSRQVSPDIAQALWEQREQFLAGQRPRSEKLTATVLFTDLEGFSTTSERMDPGLLLEWLNEYMDVMAGAVMAYGGVVEKYIGDAIMAVFGVPFARTNPEDIRKDACNAVACALAMRTRLQALNTAWTKRSLPMCGMRVGIHTGAVVAGSIGSAERQEYTVLGDSVNTASRLESFDKDWADPESRESRCRILISEETWQLVNQQFETRRMGTMPLKGKTQRATIFSVLGANKPAL
jgi:adenylate cyclase